MFQHVMVDSPCQRTVETEYRIKCMATVELSDTYVRVQDQTEGVLLIP